MLLRNVLFDLIIERVVRNCGDVIHVDHRFVFALPVVFVFSVPPYALKLLNASCHQHGIVEIPCVAACIGCWHGLCKACSSVVVLGLCGSAFFLF